jgi:hypothetical protein
MRSGQVLAHDTPQALMADRIDADVADLMAMPKRQAARIAAIMRHSGREAPHG